MPSSRNLDVLRAVAVSMVVVCHLLGGFGSYWKWSMPQEHIDVFGRVGVAIFFVHTTLVLMMSLQRHGADALPFMVRRVFRIYPLSVAVVMVLALVRPLVGAPVEPAAVLANLLLVQNITGHASSPTVLWSLPYEVQMYLVLPALFLLARGGWRPVAAVLAVCAVALLAIGPRLPGAYELLKWAPSFIPGVLAFVLMRRPGTRSPLLLFAVVLAGAVAVPVLAVAGLPEVQLMWALCLALGLTIPRCRELPAGWLAGAGATVAKYSYGVYLTHMFAIALAVGLFGDVHWLLALAGCVGLMGLMAVPAYRWIEQPGIALGARIADRMQGRHVVTVTTSATAPTKKAPDLAAEG